MSSLFADLVGRYRLIVTEELRDFIERRFVASAPAAQREALRAEGLNEANGSELEIAADGTIVSRSHGQELFRARLVPPAGELSELCFEKEPSQPVRLRLLAPNRLLALQPGKPPTIWLASSPARPPNRGL